MKSPADTKMQLQITKQNVLSLVAKLNLDLYLFNDKKQVKSHTFLFRQSGYFQNDIFRNTEKTGILAWVPFSLDGATWLANLRDFDSFCLFQVDERMLVCHQIDIRFTFKDLGEINDITPGIF